MQKDSPVRKEGETEMKAIDCTLEEIPVAKDVVRIHVFLDGLQHPQAHVRDALPHPVLAKFPH